MLLAMLPFISISAQKQWYKTSAYAQATVKNGNYDWGDWEKSNMNICIDLSEDIITVYSPRKQVYRIYGTYNNGEDYTDKNGGRNVKFYAIDQDDDKCEIRLRIEKNGNSQIYIDFINAAWVYNVTRTE